MEFFYIIIFFIILDIFTKQKKTKNKLSFVLIIILTIFAMIRNVSVGTDMSIFCWDFKVISEMPIIESLGTKYELLNIALFKLIGLFSTNYQALIIISSLIINLGIYYAIIKKQKNPLSTIIFYFTLNYYFIFFCLMRQGLALVFILFGYNFLKNNNIKKFLICIIIATLFHTSAIIFLALWPLKKINKDTKCLYIVLILSIIGFMFGKQILLFSTFVIKSYEKYVNTSYVQSSYITAGLYTLTSLCFLIFGLFIPSKKMIEEEYKTNPNYNLLKWILAIGTIISAISMQIAVFSRIYLYFGFFAIFWLSDNIELLQNKHNKIFWKIIIYSLTMLYLIVVCKYDWFGVFPYEFFWGNSL